MTNKPEPEPEPKLLKEPEEKVVFMISADHGDDAPLVVLGIPTGAWEYMREGKTHTFDLTRVGIPCRLVLFGAASHADAMETLQKMSEEKGIVIDDRRGEDFSL